VIHRVRKVLREINRRSVWQVLAVYLVGSWGILEALDFLTGFVGLPGWTWDFALVLLLVGLPIVTTTAIIQEGPPALTGAYRDEVDPNELVGRTPAEVHVDPSAHPLSREGLFTWRNATLGGVGAAALFVGSVAAYLAMWALGIGPVGSLVAQRALVPGAPVLLEDFEDRAGDPSLAAALTDAFRVDLVESPVLTLIDGRQVRDALERMGVAEGASLTPAAARELAVREGIGLVVEGDLAREGTRWVVTVQLVVPTDGATMAAYHEAAEREAELVAAVERLSHRVREKAGESLRDVRSSPSLTAVVSASLDALRTLAAADRAGAADDVEEASGLLEEAVALDPAFAMAWRRLAPLRAARGADAGGAVEAATRAWEARGRLTERERELAVATYHTLVTGDLDAVVAAYGRMLDRHPDDPEALDGLAEVRLARRQWGAAAALLERAVAGPARSRTAFDDLVRSLYDAGRKDDAMAALRRWGQRDEPDYAWFRRRTALLLGAGMPDSALAATDAAVAALAADPAGRVAMVETGGRLAEAEGRLDEAERRYGEGKAACDAQGRPRCSILIALDLARVRALRGADALRALRGVDAEAERSLAELPEAERPYEVLGRAWAEWAGDPARAEAWWGRLRVVAPAPVRAAPALTADELYRRHWIDLLDGRPADALAALRALEERPGCAPCDAREKARVFEALEEPDSAIAWLERWVEADELDLVVERAVERARVLPTLARLYEQADRPADAREAWLRYAEGWDGADAVLQPRVRAARARAAALAAAPTGLGGPP